MYRQVAKYACKYYPLYLLVVHSIFSFYETQK